MNDRRTRILQLRSAGKEVGEIAAEMHMQIQKVYRELEIARALLGALNDCHAVRIAIEEGVVKLSIKIHP